MLEDEARFGRITDPKRCWAPKGIRPLVNKQIIREYTYAYGAVSPLDGISDFIILPSMSADCMNLFLAELADRHPDEFILLISDCAPSHSEGALKIPDNIMIAFLPPYAIRSHPTFFRTEPTNILESNNARKIQPQSAQTNGQSRSN